MSGAHVGGAALAPIGYTELEGFAAAPFAPVFAAFRRIAAAAQREGAALRPALATDPVLAETFGQALALPSTLPEDAARRFFMDRFRPYRIVAEAFLTGYYEPVVAGAVERSAAFAAPILARPEDLKTFAADEYRPAWAAELAAARIVPDGTLAPYPERAAIEAAALDGGFRPVVWLRDWVEVFMVQVQGSARVVLPDGRQLRLTYAGRNGHPYSSIGRMLVETGAISLEAMSLDHLKAWLRDHGQAPGEAGRQLMQRNASYIFFDATLDPTDSGPIGGAGLPLTPLVSIAVDRTRWCYGLPFWVDATLTWSGDADSPLRRLMLAEDTGSAIVGPARVDLFFGSGEAAGHLAGGIRHHGALTVLLPTPTERA